MMSFVLKQKDFPKALQEIHDAPKVLYGEGDPTALQGSLIAVVGSRKCTAYGASVAFELAKALAASGIVVVSGLALGIDAKAHEGAIAGGGKTVAVLGCGLKDEYLLTNRPLREQIVQNGVVITEHLDREKANPWNFPRRNRIISGLSLGVVVVEASLQSGSLITARWALEQGREVFAVPGSIKSLVSQGPHRLIQQGAKLTSRIEDILAEIPPVAKQREIGYHADATQDEAKILKLLSEIPISIDQIVSASLLQPESVSALLVTMEIAGKIKNLPGGQFIRV